MKEKLKKIDFFKSLFSMSFVISLAVILAIGTIFWLIVAAANLVTFAMSVAGINPNAVFIWMLCSFLVILSLGGIVAFVLIEKLKKK
jgi:hypothetical protein